jgi:hypothetical protein
LPSAPENCITSDFNSTISVRCIRIIMRIVPYAGVYCVNHEGVHQMLGCLKFIWRISIHFCTLLPGCFAAVMSSDSGCCAQKFTGDPNQDINKSTMCSNSWSFGNFQASVWLFCPSCLKGITASHVSLLCF